MSACARGNDPICSTARESCAGSKLGTGARANAGAMSVARDRTRLKVLRRMAASLRRLRPMSTGRGLIADGLENPLGWDFTAEPGRLGVFIDLPRDGEELRALNI